MARLVVLMSGPEIAGQIPLSIIVLACECIRIISFNLSSRVEEFGLCSLRNGLNGVMLNY